MPDAAPTADCPLGADVHTLLATERRLEEMLAEARREAERIVAEARASAATATDLADGELARRGREVEADVEREEEALAEAATKVVATVERALAERLGELATFVVERLIADVIGGVVR